MDIAKPLDLRLKLGNLCLAAILSLVPTTMTIGFLGIHGMLLCRDLEKSFADVKTLESFQLNCKTSNYKTSLSYLIWVWLFVMIPTWRWFYIGHYRRVVKASSEEN